MSSLRSRLAERPLLVLFTTSLAVRLVFLWLAVAFDTPPRFDEAYYVSLARPFASVLDDWLHFRASDSADWAALRGDGVWPPLFPMLLGSGLLTFGGGVGAARLAVAIVSAATSPLVFLAARRFSGTRAAWIAGLAHVAYPSAVAFAHLLWSESLYAFLLLASVLALALVRDAQHGWARALLALLAGTLLGLCGLTRAAAIPWMLAAPVFVAIAVKERRAKLAATLLVLLAEVAVVLPWEVALSSSEGRFVPLSTAGGYDFYLGNNPSVPPGTGSSWSDSDGKAETALAASALADEQSIDFDEAARALAWQEIRRAPGAALRRAFDRFRMFWSPDVFAARHAFSATYPPAPSGLVSFAFLVAVTAYLLVLLLAPWGMLAAQPPLGSRGLLALALAAGILPALLTISMSRLHQPFVVLFLPAVGHALAHARTPPTGRGATAAALVAAALVACAFSTSRTVAERYLRPSSFHVRTVNAWNRKLGMRAVTTDRLLLRVTDDEHLGRLTMYVRGGYRFEDSNADSLVWAFGGEHREAPVDVFGDPSAGPQGPLELSLQWAGANERVSVLPVRRSAWHTWRETGLPGLSYQWVGGMEQPPPAP